MSNYPEGSMRGSGIYSQEVSFEKFDCENEECEKTNEAGETVTDDDGGYDVVCEFCGTVYMSSSISQDRSDSREDSDYDDWRDSQ